MVRIKYAKEYAINSLRFVTGALPNLPNTVTGSTAIYDAVEFMTDTDLNEFQSTIELLVIRGADLDMQSNWETPLYRAIIMGKKEIARALLCYGANVNFCDPRMIVDNICIARKHNDFDIAKMLVFAGYDLKSKTDIRKSNKPLGEIKTVYDWLVYTKYNPLSLMNLCRIRIRNDLGRKVHFKINHLGLPKRLVNFLNFEYL